MEVTKTFPYGGFLLKSAHWYYVLISQLVFLGSAQVLYIFIILGYVRYVP